MPGSPASAESPFVSAMLSVDGERKLPSAPLQSIMQKISQLAKRNGVRFIFGFSVQTANRNPFPCTAPDVCMAGDHRAGGYAKEQRVAKSVGDVRGSTREGYPSGADGTCNFINIRTAINHATLSPNSLNS